MGSPRTVATQSEVATLAGFVEPFEPLRVALLVRIRKFFWLSSGLFSAASFAIPAIGVIAFGSTVGLGTSFLAAVISACLFGLASFLHFGPEVA